MTIEAVSYESGNTGDKNLNTFSGGKTGEIISSTLDHTANSYQRGPLSRIFSYAHGKNELEYNQSIVDQRWPYVEHFIRDDEKDDVRNILLNHLIAGGDNFIKELLNDQSRMIVLHKGQYIDLTPMTNYRGDIEDSVLETTDLEVLASDATIMELGVGDGNMLHTVSDLGPSGARYIGIDQFEPRNYAGRKDGIEFMQFNLDDNSVLPHLPQADLIYSDYSFQYLQNNLLLLKRLLEQAQDGTRIKINLGQTDRFDKGLLAQLLGDNQDTLYLGEKIRNNLYDVQNMKKIPYTIDTHLLVYDGVKGAHSPLVLPKEYYVTQGVSFTIPSEHGKPILAIPPHGDKMKRYS